MCREPCPLFMTDDEKKSDATEKHDVAGTCHQASPHRVTWAVGYFSSRLSSSV